MQEPLCQPLSKVKHDLNLLPKQFEANPLPVLVEQYGKPVFAIVPIETYLVMEAAMDYIKDNDMGDDFEEWLEEEGIFDGPKPDDDEDDLEDDEDITTRTMDLLKSEGFIDDPLVRQSMKEHCLKTIAEIEEYEKSLA